MKRYNLIIFLLHSGIITALREFMARLIEHKVSVFVRRAGPNYQEGLRRMRDFGATLGIPLHVFGPETHMTAICGMALGKKPIPNVADLHFATANFLLPGGQQQQEQRKMFSSQSSQSEGKFHVLAAICLKKSLTLFLAFRDICLISNYLCYFNFFYYSLVFGHPSFFSIRTNSFVFACVSSKFISFEIGKITTPPPPPPHTKNVLAHIPL
jgi:hypothetical protein